MTQSWGSTAEPLGNKGLKRERIGWQSANCGREYCSSLRLPLLFVALLFYCAILGASSPFFCGCTNSSMTASLMRFVLCSASCLVFALLST